MPIEIREDTSATTIEYSFDGPVTDRTFEAFGLDGTPASNQLWLALTHPDIPDTDANDPHPSIPGIVAVSKRIVATTGKTATVSVHYGLPTPDNAPGLGGQLITTDASTVNEETYFDIFLERISVSYQIGGSLVTQRPKAEIARALSTLTFTVYEQTSEADISLRNIAYVEHVNDAAWFGWPEKTWRCEDIQSRPYGQSRTWREVTTVMTYNPRTWRWRAEFVNKGSAPPDATEGFGFATFDLRELADFSLLPVTPPTAPP